MTPTIVTIRPGVQFTPPAAASFRRVEADLGRPVDVNSTYRDWDRQMSMYLAWQAYVNGTGPIPPHSRAIHPEYSIHCQGNALDSDDWRTPGFIALAAEHGWIRTAASDPTEQHHFEYQYWRDQHRNDPTPTTTPALPALPEGATMADVKQIHCTDNNDPKARVKKRALIVPGTAWAVPFIEASSRTANAAAEQFETGDSTWYTESMFNALIAAHERCAPTRLTIASVEA